ncbi:MAG: efflux RND transporter periplasmic adaptor subunit [Bacteroidota bacterium]
MKASLTKSLLVAAGIAISFQACNSDNEMNNENEGERISIIPVEVSEVDRGNISAYYSNTATLEAEEEALVMAQVRGTIKQIFVEEGDYVKQGQVIAKIEDVQYRIEVQRAKATLDRLTNDYNRNKELYEKELVSALDFDNSRFEMEAQQSAYDLAKLNLEFSSIKSPINGVVSERFIKVGNLVGQDAQTFRVTDFDPLQAILYIPEHEMAKISKNQRSEIRVDALPGETFTGKVERISPVVDPTTGTFKVTVFVEDESNRLKPGMFGRVKVVYDTRTNIRMIPKAAVITEDLAQSVFVVKDSLAFRKEIQTGYVNGRNIEVLNGLDDGELVVTIGQTSLQDSARVNVVWN